MGPAAGLSARDEYMHDEQVAQLYRLAPVGLVATVINGSIVALILWGVVPAARILLWLGALLAVTLARFVLLRKSRRHAVTPDRAPQWGRSFVIGIGLSGTVWGAAGILLFNEGSTAHQVFLAFVLGGMVAGAAAAYSAVNAAFLSYSIPALAPLTARFILIGDEFHLAMAAMVLLYGVLIFMTARQNHTIYAESLALRFENRDLVAYLSEAKAHTDAMNTALHAEVLERKKAEEELRRHRDGLEHMVQERTADLKLANKRLQTEIAERSRVEEALRESEARYRQLIDTANEGVWIVDAQGLTTYVNRHMTEMLGYAAEEMLGRPLFDFMDEEVRQEAELNLARRRDGIAEQHDFRFRRKDGSALWAIVSTNSLFDKEGAYAGALGMITDITERKQAEETIRYQAYHDLLTGVANRTLFMDRLSLEIAQARRHRAKLAVLFLDLDRFKNINDSLGHAAGDRLLMEVASRLRNCLRASDTIARIGGDEFAIVLPDIADTDSAARIAQELRMILDQSYHFDGHEFHITASIGISMYPDDSEYPEMLLKNADVAMYHVKEQGRNNYRFYSPAMNLRTLELMILEQSLRQTLKKGQLELHYQPQIDLKRPGITCVEALVRWRHPELGLLQPFQFLPLAEETGLVVSIDEWVLRTACAQNKQWQDAGYRELCVTVNLSARQFQQADLVEVVSRALEETGLRPECLEIEVTESIAMQHIDITIPHLANLSSRGIGLSIDDFGTGYSSLSYLKRLPIRRIKIDKSFISGLSDDPDDQAIVTAVIAMAHTMKLQVVAEGVETDDQLSFLKASRCDAVQGYLFSRPVPADEIGALIALHR